MSGDDVILINAALNPNGKRAHEEDDDSVKRQHLDTAVTLPDSFVLPPPGPVSAFPAFAPAAVASPTIFVLPTPPPAPVYAATAPAYTAPVYVAPIATGALPRPPPSGLPRVLPDPTREVQFGPMDWVGNYHPFPRNLVSNMLTKTMRGVRYMSRRDRMTLLTSSSSTLTLSRPGSSARGTMPLTLVCERVKGYDHAATVLCLKIDIDVQNTLFASPRKKRKLEFSLPNDTDLDKLFIATLEAGKDTAKKLAALYGPVLFVTSALKITVHGSCINAGKISATAGFCAYWGPDARLNRSADCTVLKRARELNFWR
ncbi:hypothetical protein C8R44DRAFT_748458 [Mycena epipterygia]|nr:hypothetical protein C8R44DRAFT_748458 [Mycena epipterygia]